MYFKDAYTQQPAAGTRTPGCSTGTQFPPAWPEGYVSIHPFTHSGSGQISCLIRASRRVSVFLSAQGHDQAHVTGGGTKRPDGMFVFSMVDNIVVPNTPGEFVVSWRWE